MEKVKKYIIDDKNLIEEWDWEKNKDLDPNKLNIGSYKKAWWVCKTCGGKWQTQIYLRQSHKCPYCSNNKVLEGYNDLATTNPELLKIWNYEKNTEIKPTMISHGSTKTVWWKCEKGHEWKSKISDITHGNRCPYCSNQKILTGYNDLATQYPEVLQYWDYDKNEKSPTELAKSSKYKAWWKCQKGHSYQMMVAAKVRGNYHSCPICNKYKRVSLPEKIIYYYLSKSFKNIEENYQPEWIKPKELDIYLKDLKIGIEYDGYRYHKDIQQDLSKDILCEQNGIQLIRIREKECPDYNSSALKIKLKESYNSRYKYIEEALEELQKALNIKIDIDIEKDFDDILKLIYIGNKNNCIAISNPEILDEWDYDENEKIGISPFNVSKGTSLKANWICNKGHKYKASIATKTNQHTGCPYCNGRKILQGFNDLATTNPELIDEWDYEKNIKTPEQVSKFDIRKYYWKCKNGHEYKSAISMRTTQNCGCPICSGHQTLEGYNDIKTNYPELMKEWDYEKNNIEHIYPEKEKKGSNKNAWWICKNGHSYKAKISGRIRGTGCPYCSGKKVLKGFNDIATTNPELLKQWDYEKNRIRPDEITKGSHIKIWWICDKEHSYEATISGRIRGTGCPYCSGNKVLKGFNDLATTNPELLEKWNYERNNELGITPETITNCRKEKVWWKCKNGHEYQRLVQNQRKGSGKCPICKEK